MKKVLAIISVLIQYNLFAGIPALEREISLTLNNEKITAGLQKIQNQTGLIFSYPAKIIQNSGPVSLQIHKKTVREALIMLLPPNITYKSKNNYIILKEKAPQKDNGKTQVSGYIYDQDSEKKLANVTVYDKNTLQSATTDEYGYYSLEVSSATPSLSINKENYRDTAVLVTADVAKPIMNISIKADTLAHKKDSLFWKNTISEVNAFGHVLFKKFKGYVNTINIKDTITRKFQVSVVPFIGTNHRLSGSVYNHLSFNIYGGYAKGLNGFEVGGLFNLEKENVRGFQAAGLFNIVGDSVRGTQLAGLMNITGKTADGFQAAGLMNINAGSQKGFQAAGLMNINKKSSGTSAAGLMNLSKTAHGSQLAGLANVQDTLKGVAIAGLFNKSGFQKHGVQMAGLFNHSNEGETSLQLAGLYNNCALLKGIQIAPFNFADSATGVPIGLLSFVKKGVHQMEISADEMFYTNLSFRTGTGAFYNILTIGLQPGQDVWHMGYGLGTSFKIKNRFRSDISATVHHVSKGSLYLAASDLYRFYWGVEYKAGKKFSVAAGPTFNFFITDALLPDYTSTYRDITPAPLFSGITRYDYDVKGWIGGRIALRFF